MGLQLVEGEGEKVALIWANIGDPGLGEWERGFGELCLEAGHE